MKATLGAFTVKINALIGYERFSSVHDHDSIMHKDFFRFVIAMDKSVAFIVVEPLNGALFHKGRLWFVSRHRNILNERVLWPNG